MRKLKRKIAEWLVWHNNSLGFCLMDKMSLKFCFVNWICGDELRSKLGNIIYHTTRLNQISHYYDIDGKRPFGFVEKHICHIEQVLDGIYKI